MSPGIIIRASLPYRQEGTAYSHKQRACTSSVVADAQNTPTGRSAHRDEREERPFRNAYYTAADVLARCGLSTGSDPVSLAANSLLTELMLAHECGQGLFYSRDRNHYSRAGFYFGKGYRYSAVIPAIDCLRGLQLVEEERARPGAIGTRSTLWAATALIQQWNSTAPVMRRPQQLIRLKDQHGELVCYQDTQLTRRMRSQVRSVNEYLGSITFDINAAEAEITGHHVKLDGAYFIPRTPETYRVFTGGSWRLGGRLYGWWQNLPKLRRSNALINGERVAEHDYSQLHPRLLYAICGAAAPSDPYDVRESLPWSTRKDGKLALNVMINCRSPAGGIRALMNLRDWSHGWDRTKELVEAITARNAGIARYLCSCIGPRLMNIDSQIMLAVIQRCIRIGIPILPIHDSALTPARNLPQLVEAMEDILELWLKKQMLTP